jgi:hypothetical protein
MKTSGTNLEHARVHNRRVIIEAVRLHGELTRAGYAPGHVQGLYLMFSSFPFQAGLVKF